MEIIYKKKILLALSILFSIACVVFIFFTWGMYYEGDEVFANYFFYLNGLYNSPHIFWNEEYFLVSQLIVFLQSKWLSISFLSAYKFLILTILLAYFFYIFFKTTKSIFIAFTLNTLVFFVLLDNFIFVNNVRITILLAFLSVFYLISQKNTRLHQKFTLVHFYFLYFLAITSRFQIAFIFFTVFFVIAFLTRQKLLARHLAFILLFNVLLFSIFNKKIEKYPEQLQNFYKYELSIHDRGDFVLQEIYVVENMQTYLNNLDDQELKLMAKSLFILDKPTLDSIQFTDLILHPKLLDYIFRNTNFLKIYKTKLIDLKQLFFQDYKFLFLLFLVAQITLFIVFFKNTKSVFLYILGLLLYFSLPFLISIIGNMPQKILSPFLICPTILAFYWILNSRKTIIKFFLIITVGALALFHFQNFTTPHLNLQKNQEANAHTFFELIPKNEPVYVTYFDTPEILPSKLFTRIYPKEIVFIDLGGFIDYPVFYKQQNKYFEEQSYIKRRYTTLINDKNKVVYGTSFITSFISLYLEKTHNYSINFKESSICKECTLNKIRIIKK